MIDEVKMMNEVNSLHVLSIDIGTSSVRGMVFNQTGQPLSGLDHQIPYSMTRSTDGGEFIDADTLCSYVFQVLDAVSIKIDQQAIPIYTVSNCTFMHNVVGVDQHGKACTPLLNWSDTRPESVLPRLHERMDPTAYTERTGCPFHASFLPAKLLWLHESMNAAFLQSKYWMSFGEYFLFQLTGERICSISIASASGLLSSKECKWDHQTIAALPIKDEQISSLVDKEYAYDSLLPHYANRWSCLQNAKWFPTLGDGICNNIGSSCVEPNRLTLMVGTSGAMRVGWKGEYQIPPEGLWCYRVDQSRPMQGGALSNGGNLFAWMKETLHLPNDDEIENVIRNTAPDSHDLTILPFLSGQRAPRWNPNSRALIYGLRAATKPEHILLAGLEAVAMRFRLIHELLKPVAAKDHILVASGGGLLKSSAWMQIMADVLGSPVCISQVKEASCRGAALCALESIGVMHDIADADPCLGETIYPREEYRDTYHKAFERHLDIEMTVLDSPVFD